MNTIQRTYTFSAAHRLEGHPKCGRLHGHNYRLTIVAGDETLKNGMVMDFSELDDLVKPLVERLDHRYIVSNDNFSNGDPYLHAAKEHRLDDIAYLHIPYSTAEEIARWFAEMLQRIITEAILTMTLVSVTVEETDRNAATYTPEVAK